MLAQRQTARDECEAVRVGLGEAQSAAAQWEREYRACEARRQDVYQKMSQVLIAALLYCRMLTGDCRDDESHFMRHRANEQLFCNHSFSPYTPNKSRRRVDRQETFSYLCGNHVRNGTLEPPESFFFWQSDRPSISPISTSSIAPIFQSINHASNHPSIPNHSSISISSPCARRSRPRAPKRTWRWRRPRNNSRYRCRSHTDSVRGREMCQSVTIPPTHAPNHGSENDSFFHPKIIEQKIEMSTR